MLFFIENLKYKPYKIEENDPRKCWYSKINQCSFWIRFRCHFIGGCHSSTGWRFFFQTK